ncbi:MAG: SMI1/KNR4 family protein [Hyphomonadaceae bacterium]
MRTDLHAQCARIIDKLGRVRAADPAFSVFGASAHKYRIGPPVSEESIRAFESAHEVALPEHYAAFLTLVGNGAPESEITAAAGPFYGIYPLGIGIDEFVGEGSANLNERAFISPDMTQLDWDESTGLLRGEISDVAYEQELRRVFGGLLPIGHQGCQSYHALLLNGPHAGRVVNVTTDLFLPVFCYEANFLDWYERWLDEIVSGVLSKGGPTWFGYTMGGDDKYLLQVYRQSGDKTEKMAALDGFGKLTSISPESALVLGEIADSADQDLRHRVITILAEFDYAHARPHLEKLLKGSSEDQLVACKAIRWFAKEHAREWVDAIGPIAAHTNDAELFRFASYVVHDSGVDSIDYLLPAAANPDENIRQQAVYTIGKGPKNSGAVGAILRALTDESPRVVHAALQAHERPFDERFIEAYAAIATRFEVDEHYILTNLNHRLKTIGYDSRDAFLLVFRAGKVRKRGFWSRFFR